MEFELYDPPAEIECVYSKLSKFLPDERLMERLKRSSIPVMCGSPGCGLAYNPNKPNEVELVMVETNIVLRRVGEDGKIVSVPTIWRVFYCISCLKEVINFGNTDVSIQQMYQ